MLRPGEIVHYRHRNAAEEWMVVVTAAAPVAVCFWSGLAEGRVGRQFSVNEQHRVDESEVPDHVWASYCAWRLTR